MPVTWPHEQVELAGVLLFHAKKGAKFADLANIPVMIWLWWGEPFVPFRQVPRALRTWVAEEGEPAHKHVRRTARELVRTIAHREGTGKRRLVNALVDLTYRPDADPEELRDLFDDVFDPDRTRKARGPVGARVSTDAYFALVRARIETRARFGSFVEPEYRAAKDLYRSSRIDYARAQPGYRKDPDLGHLYEAPDLNELANNACADFLMSLAAVRRMATGPGVRSHEESWSESRLAGWPPARAETEPAGPRRGRRPPDPEHARRRRRSPAPLRARWSTPRWPQAPRRKSAPGRPRTAVRVRGGPSGGSRWA